MGSREIHVTAVVRVPCVPNYLLMSDGGAPLPLSAVSEEQLREIGEWWIEALIRRSEEQRSESLANEGGE